MNFFEKNTYGELFVASTIPFNFMLLMNRYGIHKKNIFGIQEAEAVECKTGEKYLSSHIPYFQARTNIPEYYQVHMGTRDYGSNKTGRVLPFVKFCEELGLV
jgi:hypothetical protein